jgi:hypothetical protein
MADVQDNHIGPKAWCDFIAGICGKAFDDVLQERTRYFR